MAELVFGNGGRVCIGFSSKFCTALMQFQSFCKIGIGLRGHSRTRKFATSHVLPFTPKIPVRKKMKNAARRGYKPFPGIKPSQKTIQHFPIPSFFSQFFCTSRLNRPHIFLYRDMNRKREGTGAQLVQLEGIPKCFSVKK